MEKMEGPYSDYSQEIDYLIEKEFRKRLVEDDYKEKRIGIKLRIETGELHPEGWFPLCIKWAEPHQSTFGSGVRWVMESKEKEEAGECFLVSYLTSLKSSAGSKLGALLDACGMEMDGEGSEFDSDDLIGQIVEGRVEHRQGGKGGTFANVVEVRKRKKAGKDKDPFVAE